MIQFIAIGTRAGFVSNYIVVLCQWLHLLCSTHNQNFLQYFFSVFIVFNFETHHVIPDSKLGILLGEDYCD